MRYKKKRSPEQKKALVGSALTHLLSERQSNSWEKRKIENFEKRTRLCNKPLGKGVGSPKRPCRKAVCSYCNHLWGKNKAKLFMRDCKDLKWENLRMLTVMFPPQSSVEACFQYFNDYRARRPRSINCARNLKKDIELRDAWRDFSLVGGLELDAFHIDEFDKLGDGKKQDLINDHKFDEDSFEGEIVYHPHFHGVIYAGELDDDAISDRLCGINERVDLRYLYTDRSIEESIETILKYSGKMEFMSTFDKNKRETWNDEAVISLVDKLVYSQGKKGFGIKIGRFKEK